MKRACIYLILCVLLAGCYASEAEAEAATPLPWWVWVWIGVGLLIWIGCVMFDVGEEDEVGLSIMIGLVFGALWFPAIPFLLIWVASAGLRWCGERIEEWWDDYQQEKDDRERDPG